jgi:hypothetical protein
MKLEQKGKYINTKSNALKENLKNRMRAIFK